MIYTRGIELLSATTSLLPVIVSSFFPISYASVACVVHCPLKFLYHVHNAYSANTYRSQLIYKKYKSFLHVGLSILFYAQEYKVSFLNIVFHILSISLIRQSEPLKNNEDLMKINACGYIGIFASTISLYSISKIYYVVSLYFYFAANIIYQMELYDGFTDSVVNLLLVTPQYVLLLGYQN
ncbi:hypothetical protein [Bathycoccus sp. RCC716 virus 3]|nr:hypothetical protein [Bathycoccus sp. RCC716 virus 3]